MSDYEQSATERYATLRGALRALSPTPEVLGDLDIESRFGEIRSLIQQAEGSNDADPTRAKIDGALTEAGTEMLAVISRFSFRQFRETLPAIRADSPGDLESLLQVCLSDPQKHWSDLVDYVVTLLATREVDGRKQIDRDPSTVSTYLMAICAKAKDEAAAEALPLASTIGNACEALANGEPLGEIVQRVRELKGTCEHLLLVPEVLREVVEFNVAVGNRILQEQEVQRSLQEAERDVNSESDRTDSEVTGEAAGSNALPAFGSFELEAVESALQLRLAGGRELEIPEHRVAFAVDVSKLSAFERDAFADRSGARVSRIVRTVVTIGLVVRHIDTVAADLERIGIDSEWLKRSSAGEIDNLAGSGIRELIRDTNFETAQQLAELRARYLNPLFDKDLLNRASAASRPNPSERAAPKAAVGDRPSRRLPDRPNQQSPAAKATEPGKRDGGIRSRAIGVSVILLLIVGAVLLTRGDAIPESRGFPTHELSQITPYLTRGATRTLDSVTTFTGTLNVMWSRVPERLKRQEALAIGAYLEKRGISIVMLYDLENRLAFHYADGRLLHLE